MPPTTHTASTTLPAFDYAAMIGALDAQRLEVGLNWTQVAVRLWEQSEGLNARLGDHAICPGALWRNVVRQGPMSCQYALTILRWIDRAPEEFLVGGVDVGDTRLPAAGPDTRLRWDLPRLHADLDSARTDAGLTWTALAAGFGCTPSRLTNLRGARQADLELALHVTQYLRRPAAAFLGPADW